LLYTLEAIVLSVSSVPNFSEPEERRV